MVGISSSFVCRGQYWLVYHPVLFFMDNIGWYISQFCLSLTILAGISPVFVCRGQYCVVNFTVVSVVDNIGWYITQFCRPWTVMVGIYWLVYQLLLSVCHGQ